MSLAPLPVIQTTSPSGAALDVAGLRDALTVALDGEVRFDRLSRALYSTDASVYQIVPLGVVLPRTEADVLATIKVCGRYSVPLTARGGGTSQAGQAIGPGVVLDFSKFCDRILEINADERWVRVQPGCVLDDLNLAVKPLGLQFAPDVSTSNRATLGGMIANNSCGAHSILYGKTVDHVLELNAVLADGSLVHLRPLSEPEVQAKEKQANREGECYRTVRRLAHDHAEEIERRYPRILRRVGGYNLDHFSRSTHSPTFNLAPILVGSEGTLGITVEAKLRLVELPRAKALLVVQFSQLLDALAATPAILAHQPAAVEVVDKYVLDSTRMNPEAARLRDFLQGDPGAILLIEFFGDRAEDLPPRLDALEADLRSRDQGIGLHRATEAVAQARIWQLRKIALGLSMAQKGDAKALSFVEDTAVAPECLRDYIAEFLQIIAHHGTTAGVYAHASVGCLHVRPVINLKTAEGVGRFEAIAHEVAELVLRYGGALSGEHGDGLVRSPFQEKMFGPVLYNAFRELKRTFDPQNLLNPGKIVDSPPLTANLRYGAGYVTPDVPTTFDFSADGGVVRAAELCAGVGACRKKREGAMCPSYQATRDEQHSTRGRANVLRLALTGQMSLQGFTDPAARDALDLCLECKACKSECPTNVDIARLKAEFLHQYYRKYGLPLRNRIFGNVARLSRWGCRLAPMSNWLTRSWSARWLNELLLGIDRRRIPPAYARREFVQRSWDVSHEKGTNWRRVLLFPDTFTNYHEPAVGTATVKVLSDAGCRVFVGLLARSHVPRWVQLGSSWPSMLWCCGRPLISNGLLAQATAHATHNVQRLYDWASRGWPIIACEPSCILTIKDDYPALLSDGLRRQAEAVASQCFTFEEFLLGALHRNDVSCGFYNWSARLRNEFRSEEEAMDAPLPEWMRRKATAPEQPFFRAGPAKIFVQGHCHQRALVGMEPTLSLLRRIPGAGVFDLDAGCCGMAGSFGYEKEHYEVSRLVGDQRLFPAIRKADAETVIVAPGFSCRMQIQHFTGRKALHPAQLLASLLPEPGESGTSATRGASSGR
jgi:FAD/FMN-containing dehydrogenase/Fe-S oxidoreductase